MTCEVLYRTSPSVWGASHGLALSFFKVWLSQAQVTIKRLKAVQWCPHNLDVGNACIKCIVCRSRLPLCSPNEFYLQRFTYANWRAAPLTLAAGTGHFYLQLCQPCVRQLFGFWKLQMLASGSSAATCHDTLMVYTKRRARHTLTCRQDCCISQPICMHLK